jgi:hypothetical protein
MWVLVTEQKSSPRGGADSGRNQGMNVQAISIKDMAKRYDVPVAAFERSIKRGTLPATLIGGEYYTVVTVDSRRPNKSI